MKHNTGYRHSITPQMADYDRIGQVWVPYLMYFHSPNFRSGSLNTDSLGFRISHKGKKELSDFKDLSQADVSLVIGGSFSFGVGASSDRHTVPSLLNGMTDDTWINFGGRAYSSTQELLLFLTYRSYIPRLKRIVLLSGVNNIILHYLSTNTRDEIGTFFFWNTFDKKMNVKPLSVKRKILKTFLYPFYGPRLDYDNISKDELANILYRDRADTKGVRRPERVTKDAGGAGNEEKILSVIKRDMYNWKMIRDALDVQLIYVLQPFANWIDKVRSAEENLLFEELDSYPGNQWKILKENMDKEKYAWFTRKMKEISHECGMPYYDMNQAFNRMDIDKTWLFVDRAHFTDEGYKLTAEILNKEVLKG